MRVSGPYDDDLFNVHMVRPGGIEPPSAGYQPAVLTFILRAVGRARGSRTRTTPGPEPGGLPTSPVPDYVCEWRGNWHTPTHTFLSLLQPAFSDSASPGQPRLHASQTLEDDPTALLYDEMSRGNQRTAFQFLVGYSNL